MRFGLLLLCVVTLATAGLAQKPTAELGGKVLDLGGAPVVNARVQIAGKSRRANTDTTGTFLVRGLPAGDTLLVIVARIGYQPVQLELTLAPGENTLTVSLERIAQQMEAMRTVTEQTGVFGVVGDTAFNIIAGADVRLSGGLAGERVTNQDGQFAFEKVKPGANMIDVHRAGYKPRLLSFLQPPKGGSKLAVWLAPLGPGDSPRLSTLPNRTVISLWDFQKRTRLKNSVAAVISRDQLTKYGTGLRLSDAIYQMPASLTRGVRIDSMSVIVDDISMEGTLLADFNADDVEMVELYPPGSNFDAVVRGGGSMCRTCGNTSIYGAVRPGGTGSGIPTGGRWGIAYVWLRR